MQEVFDSPTPPTTDELRATYGKWFSLHYLGLGMREMFAFIAFVNRMRKEMERTMPGITCRDILAKLADGNVPDGYLDGIGVVCDSFMGTDGDIPDFGFKVKDMPGKIREILNEYLPF